MFVAASTECFPHLSINDSIQRLVDLEYTAVEIHIDEHTEGLKPSDVYNDLEHAIEVCTGSHRMEVCGYSLNLGFTNDYYEHFAACCRLAKATKVVTITVPSSELGTPFNEEVERLCELVRLAEIEGVRVAMRTENGRIAEDPDTVGVLCDNAKGLGLTLDPSHYICGPYRNKDFAKVMKYVYQVYLRDTSKEKLQVQIGQGEVDYAKLISQLEAENYDRSLTTHIVPMNDVDHDGELRKMRLLIESMI